MDCSLPLLCPQYFPGKNTGVDCHFLLQEIFQTQESSLHHLHRQVDCLLLRQQGNHIFGIILLWLVLLYLYYMVVVLVAQSCPTLCDPMDCDPPGSSVHGILQARILEWVAVLFSRESSRPRSNLSLLH